MIFPSNVPAVALQQAGRLERRAALTLDGNDAQAAVLLRVLAATWNDTEADDLLAGPDIVR